MDIKNLAASLLLLATGLSFGLLGLPVRPSGRGLEFDEMDFISNLALGLSAALTPYNVLFCFVGTLLGTLVGVLRRRRLIDWRQA
ncbi:hypothetical protein GFL58_16760 [Rhizobium leguminosarum bv. viciae]|nr:hypothetical protein [Rhizobium leguminosarum bv. viciae]